MPPSAPARVLPRHHRGDGVVGLGVKLPKAEAAVLANDDPEHFYLPQYIGSRGYVGMKLSAKKVDWADVAARLAASHAAATATPKANATRKR